MPTPEQADALYDVLGRTRALLAAELRLERAALRREAVGALTHDRNNALQALRDELRETRPLLLVTVPTTSAARLD